MKSDEFIPLNYDQAMAGLDLVVDGELRADRADMYGPLTHRFLSRLLDQLDAIGRPASEPEHMYLLRAIQHFHNKDFDEAVGNGHRAAWAENTPVLSVMEEPDLSISLREKLGSANER